jgi:hypothetical protein
MAESFTDPGPVREAVDVTAVESEHNEARGLPCEPSPSGGEYSLMPEATSYPANDAKRPAAGPTSATKVITGAEPGGVPPGTTSVVS